jgi:chromosome partitioning protein
MARKIAVAVHKGGAGKTVTTKNLAAAFALRGKRTLLVDLDEQANATKGMGIHPQELQGTLNDLFADPSRDPLSVVVATPIQGLERLHILPAHPNLSKTETGMALLRSDPNNPDPVETLKGIIAPLDAYYDFMIFDTPPSLNYMTINALAAADELLIPAAASAYSEDGLARTLEAYERAIKTYNPSLKRPYILVTRVKRTNASAIVLDGISKAYADGVVPQLIVESTAVDEAEQLQQPVVTYDYHNPAAQGYIRVAEILMNGK